MRNDTAVPMAAPAASPVAPPAIRKLEDAVVNRIAAGEVIQRPSSALKELLENSLDAGATLVSVVVKDGGVKLLQVTDNGHGIRKADLSILCHRHTTSKLNAFEELATMKTLGFRGEALCSISFVASMAVTTMTAGALHGWRVTYKDSEMVAPGPKPVAAVQGTTITVEDLFYNMPTRRKALKSAADEYARVLDIVSRYAVHCAGVAFTCKRHGETRADVSTLATASCLDNIRAVYGLAVAKDLLSIRLQVGRQPVTPDVGLEEGCCFALEGFVSGAGFSSKSTTLILFINGRCVECGPMKRALEATYGAVLPKAAKPFLYLNLTLPPRHVEVNLHPTKREVGLLHQEAVIEAVRGHVEGMLLSSNASRTYTQQELPYAPLVQQPTAASTLPATQTGGRAPSALEPFRERQNEQGGEDRVATSVHTAGGGGSGTGGPAPYRPQKLVRVDSRAQTIEGFLGSPYAPAALPPRAAAVAGSISRKRGAAQEARAPALDLTLDPLLDVEGFPEDMAAAGGQAAAGAAPLGVTTSLDSVRDLAAQVVAQAHAGLTQLVRNMTLVGMADATLALVQHQTRLYLLDLHALSRDLFYQQVLRGWERCGAVRLEPAPCVRDLMRLALDVEQAAGRWKEPSPGYASQVCDLAVQLLSEKAAMMAEYINLQVTPDGCIAALPELLPGHVPDLGYLPALVLALGRDVEWEEEQPCFRGLAQALADFYALQPPLMPAAPGSAGGAAPVGPDAVAASRNEVTGAAGPGARPAELHPPPVVPTDGAASEAVDVVMEVAGGDEGDLGLGDELGGGSVALLGEGERAGSLDPTPGGGHAGGEARQGGGGPWATPQELGARAWMVKQVLFPALRSHLVPSRARASDGTVVLVTALEKLYRIFERC